MSLTISHDEHAFLSAKINAFNIATTGIPFAPDGVLGTVRRDEDGEIVAGIFGYSWGGCCDVRLLWVDESRRGQGIGSALLAEVEAEALRRGCRQVVLDTHSFQAPDFYQKLGYEIIGTVDDYPVGHAKYYLRKWLSEG